ncbi:DUF1707 SHOCT-like domain-containing protein [Actinomadura decatromicini]|uniref:DUF1707 domain-containing protein n=1 Tax=Actinomadura decatromicini TaxID=2604572 RepID=A0A5D3FD50_9ACTN|nr:DUF1707 domain-containing protein [Actinomadura decatromicini]TYK46029.1 DUF1707 domain-containing protein [Actinomadura decatromicini]
MARQDEIRIGDAERDAVTLALHDHFAAGRLDRAELDERLDAVLSARTRGDLRALVRDLPSPTGLPDPGPAPAVSWEQGAAVMFGGPGHPAWKRHHRHLSRRHRHGPHFPVFPLMLGVFLVLALTVGPGTGVLAVLQIALVVWVVKAVMLAFGTRRSRHRA